MLTEIPETYQVHALEQHGTCSTQPVGHVRVGKSKGCDESRATRDVFSKYERISTRKSVLEFTSRVIDDLILYVGSFVYVKRGVKSFLLASVVRWWGYGTSECETSEEVQKGRQKMHGARNAR